MTHASDPLDLVPKGESIPLHWWVHLAAFFAILMELSWVVPWYRTVIRVSYVAPPLLSWLVLGGVMLSAYALTQLFESLRLVKIFQRVLLLLAFFIFLVLGSFVLLNRAALRVVGGLIDLDPGAVLVLFATLWLWWRGVTLGREPARPIYIWRRFVLGLFMFIAHVFINTRLSQTAAGLASFTIFMLVSLVALVFSRVAYVSISHGVRKSPFDRRWLASTLGIVVGLVAGSVLLSSLLTGQQTLLLDQLAEGIRWVAFTVFFIISLPFLLLSYIIGPIIPLLRQALLSATPTPVLTPEAFETSAAMPTLPVRPEVPISPVLQLIIFWALVIVILLILIFSRFGPGSRRRSQPDDAESLLNRGDALRMMKKKLQEGAQDAYHRLVNRLRPAQRILAAARVRRIYANLMRLCEVLEHPRPAATTPLEFLPELGTLFPEQSQELALITDAYVRVRYGELPETMEEVTAIEEAWKKIALQGRNLRRLRLQTLKTADTSEARKTIQ